MYNYQTIIIIPKLYALPFTKYTEWITLCPYFLKTAEIKLLSAQLVFCLL